MGFMLHNLDNYQALSVTDKIDRIMHRPMQSKINNIQMCFLALGSDTNLDIYIWIPLFIVIIF